MMHIHKQFHPFEFAFRLLIESMLLSITWSEWQDSNLRHPAPKAGGMNQTILHSEISQAVAPALPLLNCAN